MFKLIIEFYDGESVVSEAKLDRHLFTKIRLFFTQFMWIRSIKITRDQVETSIQPFDKKFKSRPLEQTLEELERMYIIEAIRATEKDQDAAAILGITPRVLVWRKKKLLLNSNKIRSGR